MEYFRRLIEVSVSVIVILILSPLLQAIGEEKLNNDTNESNTESMKDGGATDYTIVIRTTGDNMTLYTDSKLIGKTPLTLTLKYGESLEIYGLNKRYEIVFKTILEGGKTPPGLLVEYNEKFGLGANSFLAITGVCLGVFSQLILIWAIIVASGGIGG